MKKTIVLLTVIATALCLFCVGCGSLASKNGEGVVDNGKVVDLNECYLGAETFTFTYDGQPKVFDVLVYDRSDKIIATVEAGEPHSDLEVIFTDNTEIGKGTVTVRAKSGSIKFSGSTQASFNIVTASGKANISDFDTLKQCVDGGLYGNLGLTADVEIPVGEIVALRSYMTLTTGQFTLTVRGKLINNGVVKISGGSDLEVFGEYENNGKTTIVAAGALINHGKIKDAGSFVDEGYSDAFIFTDGKIEFANGVRNIKVYTRKAVTSSDIVLSRTEFTYTGKECKTDICDISDASAVYTIPSDEYDVVYENNVNAGTATAVVTAKPRSKLICGQRSFEYEIARAEINTEYDSQFYAALENPNYAVVNLTKATARMIDVITLPDVTVNIIADGIFVRKVELAQGSVLDLRGSTALYGDISMGYNEEGYGKVMLAANSRLSISGHVTTRALFTGEGTITVNEGGELFFDSDAVKPVTPIVNSGGVYADFDLTDITGDGEAITRRHPTASEFMIDRTEYTGEELDVKLSFEFSSGAVYMIWYYFDGAYTMNKRPIERGDYQAKIVFLSDDKHYTGEVEFDFTVYRGAIDVSDLSALEKAIATDNYDRFTVPRLTLARPFTVESGLSITVTGTLVNNSEITVKGKLAANNIVNNADRALTVAAGGTVTAESNFYNMDLTSRLVVENDGVFRNLGAAYLCDADDPNISGTKYIRTTALSSAMFSDVATAVYGVNTTPTFSLGVGGGALDISTFDVVYEGNAGRTNGATATVNVYARRDDKTYYGHATHNYEVLPGKVLVKYESELLTALDNCNGELCNWGEIETSARILLSEPSKGIKSLRVRKGTTLIVKYDIEYWDAVPDKNKFAFANDGTIEFHNGARIKDVYKWREGGNNGVFKLYVSDKSEFTYGYGEYYEYIELQSNISISSTDNIFVRAMYGDLTVNLNGFNMTGGKSGGKLSIYSRGNTVHIYGPGNMSAIISVPDAESNVDGRVELHSLPYYSVEDPCGVVRYDVSYPIS